MTTPSRENLDKARILSQALPYMRRHADKTVVIKYGGHAMKDLELSRLFAQDVALLKQVGINPIVIHGGGPQIETMLSRLGIKSQFQDGRRITDNQTMHIVEMVLSGHVNKHIAAQITAAGGKAIGISGKDCHLVYSRPLDPEIGFVGIPEVVNTRILFSLLKADLIPVISPVSIDPEGATYNVNADTFAGAIATALYASRLLLLTDVVGVLDASQTFIPFMSAKQAQSLLDDLTITDGMRPKVETCIDAVIKGVEASVILDGQIPHAILLELFTIDGTGTMITDQKSSLRSSLS